MKKASKKKLVIDILCYTVIGISFLLALTGIILKFNHNSLYIFGKTYDVVLTDSMSSKNPEWEEFLKGHDDQIQPLDLVGSVKVEYERQLDVYDIVIFYNPSVGKDMHRIVGKTEIGSDQVSIYGGTIKTLNGVEGICLGDLTSYISSNDIFFSEISLVVYSVDNFEESRLNFNISSTDYTPTITKEQVEGGYLTTYQVNYNSTKPGLLTIAHKYDYLFNSEIVKELRIKAKQGDIYVNKDTVHDEEGVLKGSFNPKYEYEIRGDKAKTSDGKFTIDKIYSKVVTRIPKLGYLIRFLSSVWGMVMFISLGVLMLAFDIISSIMDKKEKKKAAVNAANEETEKKELEEEDEQKTIDNP